MSTLHPNIATLRSIYEDLRRIERHADEDMVLHTAQRQAGDPGRIYGKAAVVEKMQALLRESGRTLTMRVDSIVANDYFGAVLGSIRARRGGSEIGMPFCGLWRFRDGCILEHWENSYDIAELDAFMRGDAPEESTWVRG
ncbi:putative SnoaL-like aldol condensation-catalyzing enzyme [Luteibacter sp. OK325]|uniref:nuclear transport factor 2 family protein n=1 Tax=Luteibacter sp. OK325 TaxID=2135670 RepID=UPI000D36AFEA|nr:nuclear transport factor 2 family protein [Luteibacter sp. OK325]PTR34515.1 putative SnoaL-like aldol condensation-catalyzing enzyme [Luteibacter sp. OK325]